MDFNLSELKHSLVNQVNKNKVVANNLANSNTVGFKKSVPFSEYLEVDEEGTSSIRSSQDFSQGELEQTGNPLDFAITGRGFFTLDKDGKEIYSRNGHFTVDRDGFLVSTNNDPVLGEGGLINIAPKGTQPKEIQVNKDGKIYADGEMVGKLLISDFPPSVKLRQIGKNSFVPNDDRVLPEIVEQPNINQGQLEGSNVNPVQEMTGLVELQRTFESSQRVLKVLDRVMGKAASRISKVK
jgi:flagellar basal-body rod protein FlgG